MRFDINARRYSGSRNDVKETALVRINYSCPNNNGVTELVKESASFPSICVPMLTFLVALERTLLDHMGGVIIRLCQIGQRSDSELF